MISLAFEESWYSSKISLVFPLFWYARSNLCLNSPTSCATWYGTGINSPTHPGMAPVGSGAGVTSILFSLRLRIFQGLPLTIKTVPNFALVATNSLSRVPIGRFVVISITCQRWPTSGIVETLS